MTTCRLLCALLVLALCCCPSVCVAETVGDISAGSGMSPPQSKARDNPDNGQDSQTDNGAELADSRSVEEGLRNGGSTPLKRQENTVEVPKPNTEAAALQSGSAASGAGQVLNEKPGSIQVSGTAVEGQDGKKADKEIKATTSTTSTTTTKAPTTTTTTTAPEAPSTTTTTEASTTTTTRAPSRLREIDGSLSSSAWVCAPLLLAVSALAYTAVG
ncbi:putative mucin TcMUCII [Trypanosoma cruzi]|uniref:Mucin TcMUCII, putative n=2 Tax=Trypanosoma cruzi TaxID=5693 RepID=Q4E5L1_TRYCC|nr:mucin TcMUCII, putative [Trypanosoma cruzi]EAO00049.1 mucin TcMUCII, putative [Trypanosoma cruzi]PWU93366.1 putative mucin TcMUCII [Trypanosoma cruzi]|eukprot:XP_821900.1 mucin TcMUCII [Trypanosoma cruzi strain CL Brener]